MVTPKNHWTIGTVSTEPVQILVLVWYQFPGLRQYCASTDGKIPAK